MATTPVSTAHVKAVSALADEVAGGEVAVLDPANPTHRAGLEAALAAAGRTPDRYPALHAALASGTAGSDQLIFVDKGRDREGRATATVWHASGADHLYSGGTLFALDGDTGELLAVGHNSNVGEGFVPIGTDTETARPAGKSLKVVAVNHSVSKTGEVRFSVAADQAALDTSGGFTIAVDQPTLTPKNPAYVGIALGRNSVGFDADYIYYEPQNLTNPYLIVPFVGAAEGSYEIDGPLGQPIPNAVYTSYLIFMNGSTATNIPLNTQYTKNFTDAVTVNDANSTMLEWSYPYDGQSYTQTMSLVYDPQALVNETICYFFYQFQIPVVGAPTSTQSFAVCSKNTPNQPSVQCQEIANIYFWWHCLAEGTLIRLHDGSEAPIETVTSAHRVATTAAGSGDLAVEATTRGSHRASDGTEGGAGVYRLVTAGGRELIGTGQHPVQTPGGLCPLHLLAAGDEVITVDGSDRVESCGPISHDGFFFNLKLVDHEDRANGVPADAVCTYVANGIIVGDVLAQINENRRRARDVEHMRSRIPEGLLADYASAVADIRY